VTCSLGSAGGDGFTSGVGVGSGVGAGLARLPDWAKATVPKMRMRINADLITFDKNTHAKGLAFA
jgi:hypothetical protein